METNLGRRWHFAAGGRFFGPQLGDGVGQRSQRQRQLTAPDVARETADETQVGPHLTVAEDADAGRRIGGSSAGRRVAFDAHRLEADHLAAGDRLHRSVVSFAFARVAISRP